MKIRKLLSVSLTVVISASFYGCGGGGTSSLPTPFVEYGDDIEANRELKNYTNADWLFQNYFGGYGLPEEIKEDLLPGIKMVVNGFALQFSKGEDVGSSISQLHTKMQFFAFSGQLAGSVQQMLSDYDAGFYEKSNVEKKESAQPLFTKQISEVAQFNIRKAKNLDEQYACEQEKLVKDHNLPYPLTGFATKYITNIMSLGKGGGNTKKHSGIDRWNWWEADFTWVNGAAGVMRHRNGLDSWANKGGWSRVEGHYYTRWGGSDSRRRGAVRFADYKIGAPYNWAFWQGKRQTTSAYCSQLIWQSYDSQGVDIDRDRDRGAYVFPDDIRRHGNVTRFNASSI